MVKNREFWSLSGDRPKFKFQCCCRQAGYPQTSLLTSLSSFVLQAEDCGDEASPSLSSDTAIRVVFFPLLSRTEGTPRARFPLL
jgi:hypothetical protein